MKPVYQTVSGPRGNCYAACLASILEISLAEVPHFEDGAWAARTRQWLASLDHDIGFHRDGPAPGGYSISSQTVLDGTTHAVVRLDGQIAHDPSPRPFARHDDHVTLWTLIRKQK